LGREGARDVLLTSNYREDTSQHLDISGQSKTKGSAMTKQFKIIVEKHTDGYVAYPLGLKGVVIGEGDTYEEALADIKSAIAFHIETFGPEVIK